MSVPLRCGLRVREDGGRHVGVVRAVFTHAVRVQWEDTGWISELPVEDVRSVMRWFPEYGRHLHDDEV